MRRMKRYQIANYDCLIVKYAKDVRYDISGISTHDRYGIRPMCTMVLTGKTLGGHHPPFLLPVSTYVLTGPKIKRVPPPWY